MILHLYSVVDKASKRCSTSVFSAVNDEMALKRFQNTMKDWEERNILTEDMALIHLGMYETETVENKDEKGIVVSLESQIYGSREKTYIVGEEKDINKDDLGKVYGELTEKEAYQRMFGRML